YICKPALVSIQGFRGCDVASSWCVLHSIESFRKRMASAYDDGDVTSSTKLQWFRKRDRIPILLSEKRARVQCFQSGQFDWPMCAGKFLSRRLCSAVARALVQLRATVHRKFLMSGGRKKVR